MATVETRSFVINDFKGRW